MSTRNIIIKCIINKIYQEIKKEIKSFGFKVVSHDFGRSWGSFLGIDETQAQDFSNKLFEGLDVNTLKIGGKLSPKILKKLYRGILNSKVKR